MRRYWIHTRHRINNEVNYYRSVKEKTGIDFSEIYRIKYLKNTKRSTLFGKRIQVSDSFWHMHSLQEIFMDEVYRFKTLSQEPFIIDCGSNIGLSIIYFKKLFPHAKVLGFEPDPEIFEILLFNLKQFEFNNVEVFNKAVWIEETKLKFNAIGALGGSLVNKGSQSDIKPEKQVVVDTIRLKDILKERVVDFLKIDVEGAEFEIINDCLDELDKVNNLFIEYHRAKGSSLKLGNFISKLEEKGFTIYVKEAWNNLPNPFCFDEFNPMYDLQLNIFGYRRNT